MMIYMLLEDCGFSYVQRNLIDLDNMRSRGIMVSMKCSYSTDHIYNDHLYRGGESIHSIFFIPLPLISKGERSLVFGEEFLGRSLGICR